MVGQALRPIRIVHVAAPATFGGLERVVLSLAVGQQARGHEVTVATVVGPGEADGHPVIRSMRERGVRLAMIEVPNRGYLRERRRLADLFAATRPDVVHTHGYRPDVLDLPVARRAGIATVSTVHGFTAGDWRNRLYEYLDRRALRRADAVVAVSRAQLPLLEAAGIAPDRTHHVPNAWLPGPAGLEREAARAALGLPSGDFAIGFVGRLSGEKGPDVLLASLPRLRTMTWSVAFIGDGALRSSLADAATRTGIGSRVRWLGVIPDAARNYAAFDVLVLSSRTEGIPIVLFEAMAAGVPIVATRVGGVPEVLSGAEALLVPAEDPQALASAIDSVASDGAAAATRASAAKHVLAERFALEPWLGAYDDVYRRAIARRAS